MGAAPGELEQLLAGQRAKSAAKAPPDVLATLKQGIGEMAAGWAAEKAPQVGQKAPDFSLPNVRGEQVQLSSLLSNGPVVLTFYRGGW